MVQAPSAEQLARASTGVFTPAFYCQLLGEVHEKGSVFTLTVSNGRDERIFFFTRGAILFLAVGGSGGEVLARKLVAKGVFTQEKLEPLIARANADVPLLQDILQSENLLDSTALKKVVEEVIEEHLLEIALWEGSLYDLNPGNPPPRLYEPDVPAVRLSLGTKALIGRVLPQVEEAASVVSFLGGSLRHTVKRVPRTPGTTSIMEPVTETAQSVLGFVTDTGRPAQEVIEEAQKGGLDPIVAGKALVSLLRAGRISVNKVPVERTRAQEVGHAKLIEDSFEKFVNRLLTRTHLAKIYEKIQDNERAAEQYRGLAREHLALDRIPEGIASLRQVTRFQPQDLEARELLVKVLRGANRLSEASREAVDLGKVLIEVGLPGRARHALELASKLVPGSMGILWMLGGLLGKLGYREDAVKVYEELAQRSFAAGDEAGGVAAYQQILELDPQHHGARAAIRKFAGLGRALAARYALAALSVLLLALAVSWGTYEKFALDAYKVARVKAWKAVDEEKFDLARSEVDDFRRRWDLSRTSNLADSLKARIDDEERSVVEQRAAREIRAAQKLESEGKVPDALAHWRQASQALALVAREPTPRQKLAQDHQAVCETKVRKAEQAVADAKKLAQQEMTVKSAYDLLAQALHDYPWLLGSVDVQVPCRIESVPSGARVLLDGEPQEKTTPLVVSHPPLPGTLVLEARGRERLTRPLDPVPPWPLVVVLPRPAVWRASDVDASSAPVVAGDLVLVAGRDRSVTVLDRAEGKVRWRVSLGVFGETDMPPALVDGKTVVVRTATGVVVALELDSGKELWRRQVSPPQDALDPAAGRPLAVPGGVVLRDGVRGLTLLQAADGKPRWTQTLRGELLGAPALFQGLAVVALERTLQGFKLEDGGQGLLARLPRPTISAPIAGPGGKALWIAVEPDDLLRLDEKGGVLSTEREVTGARVSTLLETDGQRVVLGSQRGEVVLVDGKTGKTTSRVLLDPERPVRWVRALAPDLLVAADAATIYALDAKGDELWRHPAEDASPASADDARVYLGTRRGLIALER